MTADEEETDDVSIRDHCRLFRRITRAQLKPAPNGGYRPISGAFNNSSGPGGTMSVSLEDTLADNGLGPDDLVAALNDTYVAAITAELAREEQQRLRRSPTNDDIAHGDVIGEKPVGRRKRLASAAVWVVPPA